MGQWGDATLLSGASVFLRLSFLCSPILILFLVEFYCFIAYWIRWWMYFICINKHLTKNPTFIPISTQFLFLYANFLLLQKISKRFDPWEF